MLGDALPMKARRQSVVLDVIGREPVRSQEQLRRRMSDAGFDVTQATLSRDIRELGLVTTGEGQGAKKVLTAAALTYVAAALAALSQLAYYALVFLGNRN